jgi:competence protein ComEA
MRARGANASDEDLVDVVEYLAKNFGPQTPPARVNINTASAYEIAGALSVTQDEANAIVNYRTKNGNFKDLASLKQVPRVEAAKIDAAKDRLDF